MMKHKWLLAAATAMLLGACQQQDEKVEDKEQVQAQSQSENNEDHQHEHGEEEHDHDHDKDEHSHDDADDHSHDHEAEDKQAKQIYAGYFDDAQVQDRALTDWAGDWQSVYPYLLDGTLDDVFAHKAKSSETMDAAAYKDYYTVGYATTIDRLVIDAQHVTFYEGEKATTGEYVYDGYEILTYEKGNRGVRYIFKLAEEVAGLPTYIQFSDHAIAPKAAGHYHIYFGDDRAKLLEEMNNWPTYYPSDMDGATIVHEMIAH